MPGLNIARRIVETHGGCRRPETARVRPSGAGVRFVVRPLRRLRDRAGGSACRCALRSLDRHFNGRRPGFVPTVPFEPKGFGNSGSPRDGRWSPAATRPLRSVVAIGHKVRGSRVPRPRRRERRRAALDKRRGVGYGSAPWPGA